MKPQDQEIINKLQALFERDPKINIHRRPIDISCIDGRVELSGEVESLAAKKRALYLSSTFSEVREVKDRLLVSPSREMADGIILDHLCDYFLQEPSFMDYNIYSLHRSELQTLRKIMDNPPGTLETEIKDGVVFLHGRVQSWSHLRLAEVLAWWVPGTRDVTNNLQVYPQAEDSDEELTDILRIVLEKDPLLDASQLSVSCRNFEFFLQGAAFSQQQKEMAENDAWCIRGVVQVHNQIEVIQ